MTTLEAGQKMVTVAAGRNTVLIKSLVRDIVNFNFNHATYLLLLWSAEYSYNVNHSLSLTEALVVCLLHYMVLTCHECMSYEHTRVHVFLYKKLHEPGSLVPHLIDHTR